MKNIRIVGKRWFDRANGNTYNSARCYVDGELVCCSQFQYGYGDYYLQAGWDALRKKLGLDVKDYESGGCEPAWAWCRDNDIRFDYEHTDGLKRDCVAWGFMPEA